MTSDKRKFEIVLYGASSFVGQIITGHLASRLEAGSWAVAGRNPDKLRRVLAQYKCEDIPVLTADASDDEALTEMCKQASVVISTVGPYALYGEGVVKACAHAGTGYVDLTGEPHWIKRMQTRYQEVAVANGAQLVHCCGFDSIPSDMGVYFLQQHTIANTGNPCDDIAMRVHRIKGGASGGTVASILNLMEEARRDKNIRKQLADPYLLCNSPATRIRQPTVKKACYDPVTHRWIAPFIMAAINTRVVHWSNSLRNYPYTEHFTYEEAIVTGRGRKGAMRGWTMTLGLGGFMLAASSKLLRKLLQKHWLPKPGEGPSHKAQQQGYYDIRFYGANSAQRQFAARVTGDRDPGYGSTAKMIAECAILLSHQRRENSELAGGIMSPSACFGASLIEPLTTHAGLRFEILPTHSAADV